jgi:serine/threonine protein phosphatase PrpC
MPDDTIIAKKRSAPFILLQFASCILVTFLLSTFILLNLIPAAPQLLLHVNEFSDGCPAYGCIASPIENRTVTVSSKLYSTTACQLGCLFTRQGPSHAVNQDRSFLIRPFLTKQQASSAKIEDSFLVAILDGHGVLGHEVAEYARTELPRIVADKLDARKCCQSDDWIQQQLKDAFAELQKNVPFQSGQRGGCTASVTLRIGEKLYCANAGDSRTILVHGEPNATVIYHTRFDKPHLPDERARIESSGGRIHTPPQNPAVSRVIVFSKAANETIGLAMSRSIGDSEWKEIGVTAEPIVDVVPIESLDQKYIVAASDGLWDLRRMEFLARQLTKDLYDPGLDKTLPEKLPLFVDRIAPKKGYRDDISVVIVPL